MKVTDVLSKSLFWDVNADNLDWEKNSQLIIERALIRGGMKDVKAIMSRYKKSELIAAIKSSRDLDKITHNFCSIYFKIPKQEMHAPSQYY